MDDFEIQINLPSNCNLLYCVIFHVNVYQVMTIVLPMNYCEKREK